MPHIHSYKCFHIYSSECVALWLIMMFLCVYYSHHSHHLHRRQTKSKSPAPANQSPSITIYSSHLIKRGKFLIFHRKLICHSLPSRSRSRLPFAGEYHVPVQAAVHLGPEDGHPPARRRRLGREADKADGQVCGEHVGIVGREAMRNAGVPVRV